MGNGHSGNRRGRHGSPQTIPSPGLPPPRSAPVPPPAGYPGAYATQPTGPFDYTVYTSVGMTPAPMGHGAYYGAQHFLPAGGQYFPTNGQYYMGAAYRPPLLTPHPAHVPTMQVPQETSVVQNDLNLSKASLKLVADDANPGHYLVSFSFDATVPGSICIFIKAKEGDGLSIIQTKPSCFTPRRIGFNKGSAQKFTQQEGTGIDMLKFTDRELTKESDGVYPLIVRLETVPKNPPPDAPSRENAPPGEMLPEWVQAQTTYAVVEKRGNVWASRVLKQKLWVKGQVYELQEIYGIENGGGAGEETGNTGKECVICLSEPRDTTVLPCRHMCMCVKCADQLRHQTNHCPICRCVVESLLSINVNDRQDAPIPDSQLNAQEDQSPQATCSSSGLPPKQ